MQIFHRKGELNKEQKLKMRSLLNMDYTTNELADHIGFARRQIYRVYCHMDGHPYRCDQFLSWRKRTDISSFIE